MFVSLKQLEGLPVIWQDRQLGFVERGVPDREIRRLEGLVIRRGLGAAKWVPAESISVLGRRCILLADRPAPLEAGLPRDTLLAYMTTGERLGSVTDGILSRSSMQLLALEISPGPLHHMQGKNAYAQEYCVMTEGTDSGQAMIKTLLTWAELEKVLGKEDTPWT